MTVQLNAYIDDIALVSRTKKALIKIFNNVREAAALVRLHINENKAKYMQFQRTGSRNKIPLQINNYSSKSLITLYAWDSLE
jgi:hypothetical protein